MKHVGTILSLYISQKETSATIEKEALLLDGKGILDDKHYGKDVERSILITSIDSYGLIEAHDITIPHGSLGENLLIDYNPYQLPHGTRLQIGDTILEITQNCTLCKHLAVHDKRIPKLLKDDRGIFAKVVQAGQIKKDDTITLI
jgi:MOSC domain-containing protein YiiM